ncbi:SH3 domain-containing protein [Planktothrix sp. FACHB-1365]|uniref:SH3 domain-containing protein n=1 Tax=Planktothrix sp. FACHB-1365 TaxID=2692855 RepID=UPI001689357F|nr:SH3 domain-containing protein [Planktothrix sp. FACHB-1365]MBD2482452.1 SH3 domain-containing protein [Planktothrix sp. FACHB-1365]
MNSTAIVNTPGDTLNVRSTPNGEIVEVLQNGTPVTISGESVNIEGEIWTPIGTNRWVAAAFLTIINPDILNLPGSKIVATQTQEQIGGGLQVYQTQLIDNTGKIINTVRCVSGRIGLQIPSDEPGSQTPLPFGIYTFDAPGVVEEAPGEFGGVWSGITPTFSTQRLGLGVHYDPSAFSYVSQTGTSGCLATPTIEEREIMTTFILQYQPTHLIVQKAD